MGGEMAQMDLSLPKSLTGLFQGMLLFYLLACDLLISYRIVRKPAARMINSSSNPAQA
jgi:simple sugar transport system permease protein